MWIFAKGGFLSVVADRDYPDRLLVRARLSGDIERYFPSATVLRMDDADYLYRAFIPREEVVAVISKMAQDIDYDKFKPSVEDKKRREEWYVHIWAVHLNMQEENKQP